MGQPLQLISIKKKLIVKQIKIFCLKFKFYTIGWFMVYLNNIFRETIMSTKAYEHIIIVPNWFNDYFTILVIFRVRKL